MALSFVGQAYLYTSNTERYCSIAPDQIDSERYREAGELAILAIRAVTVAEFIRPETALIPKTTEIAITGEVIETESRDKDAGAASGVGKTATEQY